jgi:NADH:ubiquinone oxidoreductase subunit C
MQIQVFQEMKRIVPVISLRQYKGEIILNISSLNLLFVLNILKKHVGYQYNILSCISGVDLLGNRYRFCVAYDLLSLTYNTRIRVKVFVDEITPIDSIIPVFINGNWWEREIWDLYGIYFNKHTDLRRILTDYGFEGHSMRKDFPLFGFIELRYNETKKRIVSEKVQLSQEFRTFSFETPW